jgi:Divergent InlB B-repeat domain
VKSMTKFCVLLLGLMYVIFSTGASAAPGWSAVTTTNDPFADFQELKIASNTSGLKIAIALANITYNQALGTGTHDVAVSLLVPGTASWTAPIVLAHRDWLKDGTRIVDVTLADNGAAMVFWWEETWITGGWAIKYATLAPGATQWTTPATFPFHGAPYNLYYYAETWEIIRTVSSLQAKSDQFGNVTAAWKTNVASNGLLTGYVFQTATKMLGQPWGAAVTLGQSESGYSDLTGFALNKSGGAVISWFERTTLVTTYGVGLIRAAMKAPGGQWQPTKTISPTSSCFGAVYYNNATIDQSGRAAVSLGCMMPTGPSKFYLARQDTPGVWNPATTIAGNADSVQLHIGADDRGRITFAWADGLGIEIRFLDENGQLIKAERIGKGKSTAYRVYPQKLSVSSDGSIVTLSYEESTFLYRTSKGIDTYSYEPLSLIYATATTPVQAFRGATPEHLPSLSALSGGTAIAEDVYRASPNSHKYAIFSLGGASPSALPALKSTLSVSKTGLGTITSASAGINCGTVCAAPFSTTSIVTLTATPAVGYTFAGWSGACVRTAACSVAMATAKSVVATFKTTAASLPTVTLVATDPTATEAGPTTGTFTVTRKGSTATPLAVNLTYGGTATPGVDRLLMPLKVVIPAGATSATITVTPIDDVFVEPNETAIATLSASAAYSLGTVTAVTVTIISND